LASNTSIQNIDVQVTARLTLNWEEAEVLEYLTSYGLLDHFAQHFGGRFTKEKLQTILDKLRKAAVEVTQVHEKLVGVLKEKRTALLKEGIPILQLKEDI
jgi:peptide subunit release factor 1 (eRF1)